MIAGRRLGAVAVLACLAAVASCAPRPAEPPPAAADPRAHGGVVILVQTPQHLEVALLTARDLVSSHEASDVRVLACGAAAAALSSDGAAARAVAARDRAHVRVLACGLSLERAGIAAASLAPGVEVVDNGIVEVLRLQREGFRSVEL